MQRNSLFAVLGVLILVFVALLYAKAKFGAINIPQTSPPPETPTSTPRASLQEFELPQEFAIRVFAREVPHARVMVYDPAGAILVSETQEGRVVALWDADADSVAEKRQTIVSGLLNPHGLAFDCTALPCTLYVAEENAVRAYAYEAKTKKATNSRKIADLPSGDGHYTRTLLFMPSPNEHMLLISVGSSCNVCHEEDDRRAKILAYDTRTKKTEEYARGLRNAVFMAIHPVSGAIWATEMGRDGLGDDVPPDEINVVEKDKNYGWPICYGQNIHDSMFDKNTYIRNPCMEPFETPAKIDLQAHSAPLGIDFVPEDPSGGGWPEAWWYDAIVAYHGSWNRSVPTGYKLVRIPLDAHGNSEGPITDFITGFMGADGKTIGRPAGVLVQPGGTLYISDDQAGIIYKISRR